MSRADLLAWLLTYAVHSTLLLGGVWLLTARRIVRSHHLQDTFWKAALVGGLVTASVQSSLRLSPTGSVALRPAGTALGTPMPETTRARSADSAVAGASAQSAAAPSAAAPSALATGAPARRSPPSAESLLVGAWLVIAVLALLQLVIGRVRLGRRLGRREPVIRSALRPLLESLCQAAGVRRPIRLTSAPGLASPVALGRSEICVPHAVLTELEPDQQRSVLAHELAHLTRHDPIWLSAACVIERIFCFQPLNRLARRRMQETAEYICDDWAVNRTGSSLTMAKSLVKVAEWMNGGPQPVPLSGMAENSSQLLQRVRRLVENRETVQPHRRWRVPAAFALIGLTATAMPGFTAVGRDLEPGRVSQVPQQDTTRRRPRARPAPTPRLPAPAMSADMAPVPMPASVPEPAISVMAPHVVADIDRVAIREAAREAVRPMLARARGDRMSHDTGATTRQIEALTAALRDPDTEVRRAAVHSLGNLEDRRAVPGLINALRDSDAEVRRQTAWALGQLEDRRAVEPLSATLRDGDPAMRKMSAWALGQLEDETSAPALAAALKDSDADVRQTAAWALGQLDLKSAPQALIDALGDRDAKVRHNALWALSQMEDPRAVPALRAMLDDSDVSARRAAIRALGQIRDSSAMQAIIGAMQSKDADVRRAAAAALGER